MWDIINILRVNNRKERKSKFAQLLIQAFVVVQLLSCVCYPRDCSTQGLPCPALSPRVCSDRCPLSWWCYLTISSFVAPFSSCLQSFPTSGSFPMSWLFASGAKVLKFQFQHRSFQWILLCNPIYCQPTRLLCLWDFLGKNTWVGCHFPLQDIFPT